MSGSAYYDDCSCGDRFHESALVEHWPHLQSQNQALQEALRKIRTLAEKGSYDDGSMLPEIADLARNALSPTKETDPE